MALLVDSTIVEHIKGFVRIGSKGFGLGLGLDNFWDKYLQTYIM